MSLEHSVCLSLSVCPCHECLIHPLYYNKYNSQQPRLWKDGKKSRVALAEELKKRDGATNALTTPTPSTLLSSTPSFAPTSSATIAATATSTATAAVAASTPIETKSSSNNNNTTNGVTITSIDHSSHVNHHNSSNGVHRVSSASASLGHHHHHTATAAATTAVTTATPHTLMVHHHATHASGAHSVPTSPNVQHRTAVNASSFASLHNHHHGAPPPLVAVSAFGSASTSPPSITSTLDQRHGPPQSHGHGHGHSHTHAHGSSIIGKRDDTLLTMRPIGGNAGNTSLTAVSSTSSNAPLPSSSSSTPMMANEEKDRDGNVSQTSSRRSTGTNNISTVRPSDKLLFDNAKLKV
jgi:hypothetical protein